MFARVYSIVRPRLRFSCRTLFILVTCCAALCGWYARAERQQEAMATAAGGYGFFFLYDHEVSNNEPLDCSPAIFRGPPRLGYLNLFHQPRVAFSGIRDCDLPRFKELGSNRYFLFDTASSVAYHGIHWRSMKKLTSLEEIYVRKGPIQVPGEELVHFRAFPRLRILNVSGHPIGDKDLTHLEGLTSLRELYLQETHVSQEGIARLQRSMPNCRITW